MKQIDYVEMIQLAYMSDVPLYFTPQPESIRELTVDQIKDLGNKGAAFWVNEGDFIATCAAARGTQKDMALRVPEEEEHEEEPKIEGPEQQSAEPEQQEGEPYDIMTDPDALALADNILADQPKEKKSKKKSERSEKIRQMHEDGMSAPAIAKEIGCADQTVYNQLQKMGLR